LTGKKIEPERLEAIPWTRFSLEAEQQLEKQGVVERARLAPRAGVARMVGGESGSETSDGEPE
jgi:RNA polymerase-binding transcription factor DksA